MTPHPETPTPGISATARREEIRAMLLGAGAIAAGFAEALTPGSPTLGGVSEQFGSWLADGCHDSMLWLGRHAELRADIGTVLPGARTVISAAFPYLPSQRRDASLPRLALYAYGRDYHDVLRERLRPVCAAIEASAGGATRICTDSAPLPERFYAMRAGIGTLCRNGCVAIDGYGSLVVLAEILLTATLPPDTPSQRRCHGCGACARRCPGGAIRPDGTIDARRCLSAQTIERTDSDAAVTRTPDGRATFFGCDLCQLICPLNAPLLAGRIPSHTLPEFEPSPQMLTLTPASLAAMETGERRKLLARSPLRRRFR